MQVAQRIAAWLTARPHQAVLGLALTLLMPFAQILSGAAMTLLVLQGGGPRSALQALAAAALVAVLAAVSGTAVQPIMFSAVLFWLPALLLGLLLDRSRSLTLTYQVSAIVALVVGLGMYVLVPDQIEFWRPVLEQMSAALNEMGLTQEAALLIDEQQAVAPQMTVLLVATSWSLMALVLALGYGLYQMLPGKAGQYGRFRNLNFGRVLALVMALASMLALGLGTDWAQGVAFIAFIFFWVQGLALVHWLHAEEMLALPVLLLAYAVLIMPVLNAILVLGLALTGYSDAWFGFRRQRYERGA